MTCSCRFRFIVSLVGAWSVAGCGAEKAGPLESARPPYDFAPVTASMERLVRDVGLRGAALVLVHRDSVVYARGFGNLTPDTPVPIASSSKWLSGAVIAALAADGTLPLDDSVGRHLAAVPAGKGAITVRQLFSHTSGLPGSEQGGGGVDADGCIADRGSTLAACAGEILRLPLVAAPGAELRYGGVSMQLAGHLAERAAAKPWGELFRERVATPLGLTATSFGSGANPRIAGGAVSSGQEYARFLRMLLAHGRYGGRQVLPAEAVRLMELDQTRGARIVFSPHARYGSPDVRYGIGVWRDRVAPDGTALQVSSQGAFGFSPWIDREHDVAGVFVVQHQLPAVYRGVDEIQRLVREAVLRAHPRQHVGDQVSVVAGKLHHIAVGPEPQTVARAWNGDRPSAPESERRASPARR